MTRYEKVMDGAAYWGAFYRENPDEFAKSYLHLRLRWFQRILLCMMFWCTVFVYVAARGQGKSFLSAVYCVIRAILFPGTKIVIASRTRSQAQNVIDKILLELCPMSPELKAEINYKDTKVNGTNAQIVFYNTSVIKVVTATDSSRGNRANVLLLDEYRLISKDTIDTILRKFLTLRRMPKYEELTDQQRLAEYDKEKNLTMYLSSAYFKDHWSYTKCVDTFKAMLYPDRHQFVCGFPYQLSIREGLLDREAVADEMAESDFSEIKYSMEMCAEWYGSSDGSFFEFDTISRNRHIRYPMLPDRLSAKLANNKLIRIPKKVNGEIRILSADIALMSSHKHNNDATAIFVNQMMPTKAGRYMSNIVFGNNYEGLRTDDQALIIRKLYDEYECDYLVLDANGIGLGLFDCLARDMVDQDTGEVYPALSCYNNPEMAMRCTVPGAEKVIWAIKASAQQNSDMAFQLREGFRSGRIRLLVNEYDADKLLGELPGYNALNPPEKIEFQLPYINTTLLIDELIKLQHEESNGRVRIFERSGMRKDRYSSLSYNYYVATQLENKLTRRSNNDSKLSDIFVIRPPSNNGRAVSLTHGNYNGWNHGG